MATRRPVGRDNGGEEKVAASAGGESHGHSVAEWFRENDVEPLALAAELIGTFLFQFLGGLMASNSVDSGLTTAAFGNGCALAVMIYSTARVSGGHLNPAISTALLLIGEGDMTPPKWSMYLCSQFSGALLSAMCLRWLLPDTSVVRNPFVTQGILSDGVSRNLAGLGIFEFFMTFALVRRALALCVLHCAALLTRLCGRPLSCAPWRWTRRAPRGSMRPWPSA